MSVLIFLNYRVCQSRKGPQPPSPPTESTTTTNTVGPTTTTEVRNGMNLCDPLMKKNGYEINMVICEANEICQPLSSTGEMANIGYIFFSTVFKIYMS